MPARPPAPIRIDSYPFPALLYLEWALLAVILVSLLLPNPFRDTLPSSRLLAFASAAGLGLMGLRLPQGKLSTKLAYAALQIGLLLLASWWGGIRGLRLFPLLCVVLVIRNCLIFQLAGRLVTSALLYFLFLVLLVSRLSSYMGLRFPLRQQGIERFVIRGFAFNSAVLLLLVMIFLMLLMHALITERQSRDQLLQTLPGALRHTIQDNGSGFRPEQNPTGFGLQGMQERAVTLGGRLDICSAPGQGCQITAQFPLSPDAP